MDKSNIGSGFVWHVQVVCVCLCGCVRERGG